MTQEHNELLLIDICARLPYKVKISIPELANNKEQVETLNEIFNGKDNLYHVNDSGILIEYIKPYLFPLSSMTNEQKHEYQYITERWMYDSSYSISDSTDWLNKNHFDYRGLIESGLAIDATNLNIY